MSSILPPGGFPGRFTLSLAGLLVGFLTSCAEDLDRPLASGPSGPGYDEGKEDSGWIGPDTYEVGAVVRSRAQQQALGEWSDLAADAALQATLVDDQLKFIKNTAESLGWRFNQLADSVRITELTVEGDVVTVEYEAVVDMLGRFEGALPTLESLASRTFTARVPRDPVGFSYAEVRSCSATDDGSSAAEYNFHYYFAPEREGCTLALEAAEVEITEVFERRTVYPEYDQLMQPMDELGHVGFRAALVPNVGDTDRMSRFNAHARMLERDLGLEGVEAADGTYRRYTWLRGPVVLVIDLYDPTRIPWGTGFEASFRERLGEYTLIHYNGHSAYGTKHLLDDPESFTERYQIIMMHSCQSYAYYTRQVFRAKRTDEDPTGFALADVVATGMSSYPSGSPPTVRELLRGLMDGMAAVYDQEPEKAPDWLSLTRAMGQATWGDIMYGVAGVRTNRWRPE
jgi:hypothetical protein